MEGGGSGSLRVPKDLPKNAFSALHPGRKDGTSLLVSMKQGLMAVTFLSKTWSVTVWAWAFSLSVPHLL